MDSSGASHGRALLGRGGGGPCCCSSGAAPARACDLRASARELGLPLAAIRASTTDTSKIPNTSATAASSGSDLNGMAAAIAARELRERLREHACEHYDACAHEVRFADGRVHIGGRSVSFAELCESAYTARVSLSAVFLRELMSR